MLVYLLYCVCSPFLFLLLHFFRFFNSKINIHIKNERISFNVVLEKLKNVNRKRKKILLFHAASAGEFEQIKPILKYINKKNYFIIQTFTSPTIFIKEKDNDLFDVCCYHPYDFLWSSFRFFYSIRPDFYIVTRHDVWPTHLFVLKKLNIASFYINANLHKKSIWLKPFLSHLTKAVFNKFNLLLVPSENIKNLLLPFVNENKIIVSGDSRFDQIINRKKAARTLKLLPDDFNHSTNIIFGSYDYADENIILNSLLEKYPKGSRDLKIKNHRILLVPHEPEEKSILVHRLIDVGFKVDHFSSLPKDGCANILYVDTVGVLADLYKYCALAYIGSGFSDGVHSVIEPGAYGCVTAFGPNIELLDEAKYIYKNNLGVMVFNAEDLFKFYQLLEKPHIYNQLSDGIKQYVLSQKGSSKRIISQIVK